ncbi:MAG TPA: hypothetical protein VMW56_15945 [Candidatus Margulisiibacteriota bacterium]|nr:hypothetical protein [Candidatus Margulisiibacteriota bacterium]
MKARYASGWVVIALWLPVVMAIRANATDVPVDDFSEAQNTGVALVANQVNVPVSATDSGLMGVIGGVRQLTVEATDLPTPIDNVDAKVDTTVPGLCFNLTPNAKGNYSLLYDKGGAGLDADLSEFLGIRTLPIAVDLGLGGTQVSYTLTLVDAANHTASQTVAQGGCLNSPCQEIRFLLSDFAGVSLRSVRSVMLTVSSDAAFDELIGPILLFGTTQRAPLLSPIMIGALVVLLGGVSLKGMLHKSNAP